LKLMIAYSTVAQIGYLFFLFPLAGAPGEWERLAWTGGMMQLMAHAVAKAAMFMAAGMIGEALGHDRIAGFGGIGRALPVVVFAFGLAGMSLMGLPPSAGFVAKAMLLTASIGEGQWWWAIVIMIGGLLAAGYTFRVLARALASDAAPVVLIARISRSRQAIVLALAICTLLLGLVPLRPSQLLEVGRTAQLVDSARSAPGGLATGGAAR
jgi:multicomponent Na+:H+ antiporter subunit D